MNKFDLLLSKCKPGPMPIEWLGCPEDKTECLLWTGTRHSAGYGVFRHQKKTLFVHRYFYEQCSGLIPKGKELDHLCRVRNCVNPLHLQPVSHKQNMNRSPVVGKNLKQLGLDNRKDNLPLGVTKNGKYFQVSKNYLGEKYYLGTYRSIAEAVEVYKDFCLQIGEKSI